MTLKTLQGQSTWVMGKLIWQRTPSRSRRQGHNQVWNATTEANHRLPNAPYVCELRPPNACSFAISWNRDRDHGLG